MLQIFKNIFFIFSDRPESCVLKELILLTQQIYFCYTSPASQLVISGERKNPAEGIVKKC